MVSLLRQTESGQSSSYLLERGGQTLCTAESPFSFVNPRIDLSRGGTPWLRIAPNLGASFGGMVRNGVWRTVPCDIIDAGGGKVGSVAKVVEGSWFRRQSSVELRIWDRTLRAYEIGLGRQGMKYPLYDGAVQIAQVEKDPVVYDNLDEYRLYSLDEFGETAALLFALFLDFHRYRNAGEYATKKKNVQYVFTGRKEILAKYDPSFRARCEGRRG